MNKVGRRIPEALALLLSIQVAGPGPIASDTIVQGQSLTSFSAPLVRIVSTLAVCRIFVSIQRGDAEVAENSSRSHVPPWEREMEWIAALLPSVAPRKDDSG